MDEEDQSQLPEIPDLVPDLKGWRLRKRLGIPIREKIGKM